MERDHEIPENANSMTSATNWQDPSDSADEKQMHLYNLSASATIKEDYYLGMSKASISASSFTFPVLALNVFNQFHTEQR
jgi:hypothetical protein